MSIVYLNGDYPPIQEAKISVMDRGFLFGDGVYEVLPVYSGTLFQYDLHLERLRRGLAAIEFQSDFNVESLQVIFQKVIEVNSDEKVNGLYLQITRGIAETRNH